MLSMFNTRISNDRTWRFSFGFYRMPGHHSPLLFMNRRHLSAGKTRYGLRQRRLLGPGKRFVSRRFSRRFSEQTGIRKNTRKGMVHRTREKRNVIDWEKRPKNVVRDKKSFTVSIIQNPSLGNSFRRRITSQTNWQLHRRNQQTQTLS